LQTGFLFWDSIVPLPEHAAVRMVNSTMNERRKKQKDEEKTKRQKEQMKLDRGRRRQGLEEKEEEDDDDDGVHWDELVHGGEDSSSQQTRPFLWHAQEQEREDTP
jgi:hypothetical protein